MYYRTISPKEENIQSSFIIIVPFPGDKFRFIICWSTQTNKNTAFYFRNLGVFHEMIEKVIYSSVKPRVEPEEYRAQVKDKNQSTAPSYHQNAWRSSTTIEKILEKKYFHGVYTLASFRHIRLSGYLRMAYY